MNESERYHWTFDRRTGEPIGIIDTAYSPAPIPAGPGFAIRKPGVAVQLHPKALLLLVGFAVAVGLYGGVLLFGHRVSEPAQVVVCPAATEQVAARPAECGPSASQQAVTR